MNLLRQLQNIYFDNSITILLTVILSGLLISKIKFREISLGISSVLFTGILFGHLGFKIDSIFKMTGLILFLFSVGTSAGPEFLTSIKSHGKALIFTAFIIVFTGAFTAISLMKINHLSPSITAGIFTGALTSTPGLAAAVNAVISPTDAAAGYAAAYPFGVIGVILAVNIAMALNKSPKKLSQNNTLENNFNNTDTINSNHFIYIAFTILLGIIIGSIKLFKYKNISFKLGITAGILLTSIAFSLLYSKKSAKFPIPVNINYTLRQIGLLLFLSSVGTEAGSDFIELVTDNGISIILSGMLITILPLISGYLTSKYIFKIEIDKTVGLLTGGMTSTPGLAAAEDITQSPETAAAYAAVYPFAMIFVLIGAVIIAHIN